MDSCGHIFSQVPAKTVTPPARVPPLEGLAQLLSLAPPNRPPRVILSLPLALLILLTLPLPLLRTGDTTQQTADTRKEVG